MRLGFRFRSPVSAPHARPGLFDTMHRAAHHRAREGHARGALVQALTATLFERKPLQQALGEITMRQIQLHFANRLNLFES